MTIIEGNGTNSKPEYLFVTHHRGEVTLTLAKKLQGPPRWNSEDLADIVLSAEQAKELKASL